ncbi:hypothetical protein HPB50_021411 [Hyalomma asiaticum]|uniref:Uncharacterized protein n=1 Tax=Hyalomma asiaticum TaxID=266040 RepID=A0ACB7RMN6_HYAAI|nr:hypothetical protein HPB50_021411 [Hyalomma asiaticum]
MVPAPCPTKAWLAATDHSSCVSALAATAPRNDCTDSPAEAPFCADEETLEHPLRYPNADAHRQVLLPAYRRLGLPRSTVAHLLFPACARSSAGRAFTALLEFIEAAGLRGRF